MSSVAWGGAGLALFVSFGCNGATAPSPAVAAAPSPGAADAGSRSRTVTHAHSSVAGCSVLTDSDLRSVLKLSLVRRSSAVSDELEHTCTDTFEVVSAAPAPTRGASTPPEQVFAIHEYRDLRLINTPEKLKLLPSGYAEEWPMNLDAEAKLLVPLASASAAGVDEAAKVLILRKNGRLIVLQSFAKTAGQPTFNKAQLLALGKTISGRM